MQQYYKAQQMLYRDKLFNAQQMKTLIDATRNHMSQYVVFEEEDYSMLATITDGIQIDISIKVKSFLPTISSK